MEGRCTGKRNNDGIDDVGREKKRGRWKRNSMKKLRIAHHELRSYGGRNIG
jgi:hypothetical protein